MAGKIKSLRKPIPKACGSQNQLNAANASAAITGHDRTR
jgi:hypothetical protein